MYNSCMTEINALQQITEVCGIGNNFVYREDDDTFEPPIYEVCDALNIEIRREELSQNLSGTLRGNVITINKKHSPRRRIFTLAHELGHFLYNRMHNRQNDDDRRGYYDNPEVIEREKFANDFAARFLMPEDDFTNAYRRLNGNLVNIADYFLTSVDACKWRAINLGLYNVFSNGYYGE